MVHLSVCIYFVLLNYQTTALFIKYHFMIEMFPRVYHFPRCTTFPECTTCTMLPYMYHVSLSVHCFPECTLLPHFPEHNMFP